VTEEDNETKVFYYLRKINELELLRDKDKKKIAALEKSLSQSQSLGAMAAQTIDDMTIKLAGYER